MAVTHYEVVEKFEITRVVPERDTIQELIDAAAHYNDENDTWTVDGMCVEFKRPMGGTTTPRREEG